MLVFGALLTAFYMTRQVSYVFFGDWRGARTWRMRARGHDAAAGDSGVFCHGAGRDWNAGVAVVPGFP